MIDIALACEILIKQFKDVNYDRERERERESCTALHEMDPGSPIVVYSKEVLQVIRKGPTKDGSGNGALKNLSFKLLVNFTTPIALLGTMSKSLGTLLDGLQISPPPLLINRIQTTVMEYLDR